MFCGFEGICSGLLVLNWKDGERKRVWDAGSFCRCELGPWLGKDFELRLNEVSVDVFCNTTFIEAGASVAEK